jgi:hypothetical protein
MGQRLPIRLQLLLDEGCAYLRNGGADTIDDPKDTRWKAIARRAFQERKNGCATKRDIDRFFDGLLDSHWQIKTRRLLWDSPNLATPKEIAARKARLLLKT